MWMYAKVSFSSNIYANMFANAVAWCNSI